MATSRILTTKRGEVNTLAKMFKVSRITVWNALNGRGMTDKCQSIRKTAIKRGAIELD